MKRLRKFMLTFIKCLLFSTITLGLIDNENESWNTLYSLTNGKIYLHLKNNDLISLNFSISGFDNLHSNSHYLTSDIDYSNDQKINKLASPPENSTLTLINDDLYAFLGNTDSQDDKYDTCGEGVLSLQKYDSDLNDWKELDQDLDFDDVNDSSYYRYATYFSTPTNNNTIYLYGGYCDSNSEVTNRLLSLDLNTFKFSNITTTTKPQSFYGASNLLAPNPQTQLVIGGESDNSWLNMYQLATWNFESGWSFKQIESSTSGNTINSRKFSLSLPIFKQLSDNKIDTISNHYNVEEVLVIGGEVSNSKANPIFSKLSIDSNYWYWNTINDTDLDYDEILGAATIFNTLVIINSTSDSSKSKRGESDSYSINLYDTSNLKSVDSLKENTTSKSKSTTTSNKKNSVKKKAILGTVLPVTAIGFAVVAGLLILNRRKRKRNNDELETIDYQFGNYFDQQSFNRLEADGYQSHSRNISEFTTHHQHKNINSSPNTDLSDDYTYKKIRNSHTLHPNEHHSGLYKHENETNSTIDVASIDSWFKKRQEFDENRLKTIKRNSYLASNETLSNESSIPRTLNELQVPSTILTPKNLISDEDPFIDDEQPPQEQQLQEQPQQESSPLSTKTHPYQQLSQTNQLSKASNEPNNTSSNAGVVNKSVSRLKKSFSFTHTPPGSPMIGREFSLLGKKKSTSTIGKRISKSGQLQSLMDGEISENEAEVDNYKLHSDTTHNHVSEKEMEYDNDQEQHEQPRAKDKRSHDDSHADTNSIDITNIKRDYENIGDSGSCKSLDDKVDVQVLVSSKRRSKLRVVNPDIDLDELSEEDQIYEQGHIRESECDVSDISIRKRVPSGDKDKELD